MPGFLRRPQDACVHRVYYPKQVDPLRIGDGITDLCQVNDKMLHKNFHQRMFEWESQRLGSDGAVVYKKTRGDCVEVELQTRATIDHERASATFSLLGLPGDFYGADDGRIRSELKPMLARFVGGGAET